MSMRKFKFLALFMVMLLGLHTYVVPVVTGAGFFKDVEPGHWAYESIQKAVRDGVVDGFPDGTFRPDQAVTEEQFARMTFHTLVTPVDLEADQHWSDFYYIFFKENETPLKGHDDLNARARTIDRGFTAVFIASLVSGDMMDEDEAIRYMFDHGFTRGVKSGGTMIERYAPRKALTRAEAVVILQRVYAETGMLDLSEPETEPDENMERDLNPVLQTNPDLDKMESMEALKEKLQEMGYTVDPLGDMGFTVLDDELPPLVMYTKNSHIGVYDYTKPDAISIMYKILEFDYGIENREAVEQAVVKALKEPDRYHVVHAGDVTLKVIGSNTDPKVFAIHF
ncbi:MAG: S-layer homology domain-containing protein [Bacillaceae bacterium]|nr:S-layer homology domain-containing protein [Bacillaceae bacterium]